MHKNHRSVVTCEEFVKSDVTNLLQSGCIMSTLSPLSVASNKGKKRLN